MTLLAATAAVAPQAADVAMLGHAMTIGAWGLILIGLFAMVTERDLVRIIFGLVLIGSGVNLFVVAVGFRPDAVAPILTGDMSPVSMVDPIPQALVLTSIVIDVGVLALALALGIRVQETLGTLDTRELQQRVAEATAAADSPKEAAPQLPKQADKSRALEEVSS